MPMFTVHHDTTLEVEADDFQGARDRAIEVLYNGEELRDAESVSREITCITDENDREEPEADYNG